MSVAQTDFKLVYKEFVALKLFLDYETLLKRVLNDS